MGATAGRWSIAAVVALFVLSAILGAATVSPPSRHDGPTFATESASGTCEFLVPTSGVRGELTIDGGPLPPNATADVTLTYTYALGYRTFEGPNDTVVSSGCVVAEGNTTTAANGSFSFMPSTPPTNCTVVGNEQVCTGYSGAYVPIGISLAAGPPPGYGVSVVGWSTSIAVALVYELARVTVAPGGPTVATSVGAPTGFTASAWMANGSVTTLATTFSWSVNGTGWSWNGPTTGRTVSLTAVPGASVATVTVRAAASVGGVGLAPVAATVDVVAISTEIETAETNRTVLDAGESMTVSLTAFGAAGFPYSAYVEPGLGLSELPAPCSTGSASEGTVEVVCTTNVSYPSAGTAQPTANVTNGYSSASWRFPDIVVDPPPELEVNPSAPVGYALAPLPLTVTAANGSGVPPYLRACLEAPPAPVTCQATPGPVWSFSPTFAVPGNYSVTASAVDADGLNASRPFTVEVVPPLALGPVSPSVANATVGAPVDLHATVTGGVAPLRYWWNVSGEDGPLLSGDLAADGTLTATVAPAVSGPMAITLTVLDHLGTVVASELLLSVGPAAAGRIAVVTASPADPVTVGEPVPLAWGAFDASGAMDRTFEASGVLSVTSAASAPEAWINASGVGPLAPLGGGAFGVPASAWIGGVLHVNVTVGTAAVVAVGLSGTALPGVVPPMNLSVEADRTHVRLFSPTVARAGGRTNATLWRAEDPFGNPVPGALLTIDLSFGGERDDEVVTAVTLPRGGSGVWVNYTAPTAGNGEVTVLDAAGAVVLGPLLVPAAPTGAVPDPTVDALAAAVPVGAAGAATFAVMRRRRRARQAAPAEDELRRLAEGRARAVELIERAGTIDLAGLEAEWGQPPPAALVDWLASLVADGTVRAVLGDDGRARFCLAHGPVDKPQVTFDPEALDRSLRRRDEALGDPGPEGPPR